MGGDHERHPLDPEDTDWGQKQERRHNEHGRRFGIIEHQLDDLKNGHARLSARLEVFGEEHREMRRSLEQNTRLTQQVKDDTQIIVDATRGIKLFGTFTRWIVSIVGGVAAGVIAWLTLHR